MRGIFEKWLKYFMINSVQLENFGPISLLDWQGLGQINLVIGNNGSGKTFLLKAIYTAVRTLEDYKRGDNPDSAADILANKLYWTFQAGRIGDLVAKPGNDDLSFRLTLNEQAFNYSLGKDASNNISTIENHVFPRSSNSIFLPAKEVLSFHHIILKSRQQDQVFGFDDTYLDLAQALQFEEKAFALLVKSIPKQVLPNAESLFSGALLESKELLKDIIGGRINFDKISKRWYFEQNHEIFYVGATAEGINKIAILDRLLGSGFLDQKSIIFIDEPEAALHPEAISKLLDIIAILAKHGMQFFLASHSYFVIKKLFLIAQEQKLSIPVLSNEGEVWQQSDLLVDMPDNPIIDESIRLYEEEVNLAP